MERGHGGQRQLHRQEHRDHHDQHHRGAATNHSSALGPSANHSSAFRTSANQSSPVCVPLPPVPGLLVGESEDGQSSEKLTKSDDAIDHIAVPHFISRSDTFTVVSRITIKHKIWNH